jgi:hypothetical protein
MVGFIWPPNWIFVPNVCWAGKPAFYPDCGNDTAKNLLFLSCSDFGNGQKGHGGRKVDQTAVGEAA